MTESEAWEQVAKKLQTEYRGLCDAMYRLWERRTINVTTYNRMSNRLDRYLGRDTWAYPRRCGEPYTAYIENHREARILAALWLAEEARHD